MLRSLIAGAAVLLVAGCASRAPLVESPAATPGEQWQRLQSRGDVAEGRRAYSRLQWEGEGRRIGFDATLVTDDRGHLLLEALTPVGTAAATLWSDGEDLVFLNHRNNSWWEGPLDSIPDAAPLVPALRAIGVDAATNLLFGYPVTGEATTCESGLEGVDCHIVGGVRHHVMSTGLLEASTPGARVSYESPSVPATRLSITAPSGTLSIMHRAIEESGDLVERPSAPSSWRCCVLPAFE